MARFAIIENEVVTNIIEADAEFSRQMGAVPAGSGAIGDRYVGGKFTKPIVEIESLKVSHTLANNSAYEAAIGMLTGDYPAAEINTWERQRAEVVAWAADPAAPTPWIDTAASVRGLDRGEYLLRTLVKVNAFAMASAYLTGRRQGIDDQIRAATTAEELAAVVIDYTLPGA